MRPNLSWQQQQVVQRGVLAPDCSPGAFRLDLENPFSPRQVLREVQGLHLGQGRHLPALFGLGLRGQRCPGMAAWLSTKTWAVIILHPWELVTPNALGWVAGPTSPQEAAARPMSPASPTVLLAANPEVGKIPPK